MLQAATAWREFMEKNNPPVRLGIIGSENSHALRIAEICNLRGLVPMQVTHLWGETAELGAETANAGKIPNQVEDWRSMEGQVDGVMVDHRHGDLHGEAARHFLSLGMPVFVDKPMTCGLSTSCDLLRFAQSHKAPLLTFSSKPLQARFQSFAREIRAAGGARALHSCGPCDAKSIYGGVFFYGIHQVDAAVEVLGTDAESVSCHASGGNVVAVVLFPGGRSASMQLLLDGNPGFHWTAHLDDGRTFCQPDESDPLPYLKSASLICGLLARGEVPFSAERMLAPIAILEAMELSLKSGRMEKVGRFNLG
jgi:predicted dehydrogenase